jgi:hypothetical protein
MTTSKLPPSPPEGETKPKHRKRFVMIDPLSIDRKLLYFVDGKPRSGLILEVERGADGEFSVRQATPAKLLKQGVRGKVVGNWHTLRDAEKKGGSA